MSLIVAGVACGAVLVAGCGVETVAGEAGAVKAGSGEPAFSPCDDIPDEALLVIGLDPATESRDIRGVKQPGWNICRWDGTGYFQSVLATTYTLDDVRANERNTDFQRQTLGELEAYSYREVADEKGESCDVAVQSVGGAVLLRTSRNAANPTEQNPCDLAMAAARALEPVIPR